MLDFVFLDPILLLFLLLVLSALFHQHRVAGSSILLKSYAWRRKNRKEWSFFHAASLAVSGLFKINFFQNKEYQNMLWRNLQ